MPFQCIPLLTSYECSLVLTCLEIYVHKIGVQLILMEQEPSSSTIMTTKSLPNLKGFAANIKWDPLLMFLWLDV